MPDEPPKRPDDEPESANPAGGSGELLSEDEIGKLLSQARGGGSGPASPSAETLNEDEIGKLLAQARGGDPTGAGPAEGDEAEHVFRDVAPEPESEATGDVGDILGEDEINRLMAQARTGPTAVPGPLSKGVASLDDDDIEKLLVQARGPGGGAGTDQEVPNPDSTLAQDEIATLLSSARRRPRHEDGDEDGSSPMTNEEALDQTGIDAIMLAALHQEAGHIFRHDGRRFQPEDKVVVDTYDFSNPVFMTESEMRQVRIRHEQYIHHLSARLSMFLRMDYGMKMAKLFTSHYKRYIESIPNPTHISLFRLEQFPGVGIVDMNPRLAMTMVDRLLGGAGHSIREERYLTELETVLVEDIVRIVLEEWCTQWEDMFELNATVVGSESSGRFLQTSPHDAIMLILAIECTIGDCTESIQIGIPYYTIEPVIKKMQQEARKHNPLSANGKMNHWWQSYNKINVRVAAEWPAFTCSVRDLIALRPGDVLELPRSLVENTQIRFQNSVHFIGKVGIQNDHVAVEVTRKLKET